MSAPHVLVAMPAHDEEATVTRAVTAVVEALAAARDAGTIAAGHVVVAAHRCTDRTADLARAALAPLATGPGAGTEPGLGVVVEDAVSTTVGEVRDRAVRHAVGLLATTHAPDPRHTWLLSTDADSVVPRDWVGSLLGPAEREDAVAVAGMVRLVDWHATDAARATYAAIVAAGIVDDDHHTHAYAANMAVRLDAYLAVGGFASVVHGEDSEMLAALRRAGHRVTSTRHSVVHTSGRMPGRATHGLGGLLGRIAVDPEAAHAGVAGSTADAVGSAALAGTAALAAVQAQAAHDLPATLPAVPVVPAATVAPAASLPPAAVGSAVPGAGRGTP